MRTSQLSQSVGLLYSSFEESRRDPGVGVRFSAVIRRLFWQLDSDLPATIPVMTDPRSANDMETFFRLDTGDNGTGTWHEVSQLPISEAKVSSIEASIYKLDQWESDWMAWHKWHKAPEFGRECVTYGDLDDDIRPYADEPDKDGDWEADSDTEFVIRCCGEDRPLRKRGQKSVIKPSKSFVIVKDYVNAVHPWFMLELAW